MPSKVKITYAGRRGFSRYGPGIILCTAGGLLGVLGGKVSIHSGKAPSPFDLLPAVQPVLRCIPTTARAAPSRVHISARSGGLPSPAWRVARCKGGGGTSACPRHASHHFNPSARPTRHSTRDPPRACLGPHGGSYFVCDSGASGSMALARVHSLEPSIRSRACVPRVPRTWLTCPPPAIHRHPRASRRHAAPIKCRVPS
jgi:hypothetical protein